jgi:DNA-binding beta-propeller fold protein YncE
MRLSARACTVGLLALLAGASTAQGPPNRSGAPLQLGWQAPMANVHGRLDHVALDPKHARVILTALGNNTVEIYQLSENKFVHSIVGLGDPQAAVYAEDCDRLVVSDDNGKVRIYDGTTYKLLHVIDYGEDGNADNLRYDPVAKKVYISYGDGPESAIGTIDPATGKVLPETYKLDFHAESFQLERSGSRIFANIPEADHSIAVIDRRTGRISKWQVAGEANFPMALDEANHRLFVGTRVPARLFVLDTDTGKTVASLPAAGDTDDLFYDAALKRIYVIGGAGSISVFQQKDADHYDWVADIPTSIGARTGFFAGAGGAYGGRYGAAPLYLAVPERGEHPAALWVFATHE